MAFQLAQRPSQRQRDTVPGNAVASGGTPQTLSADDPLVAVVELLFFAYRDFTGEPDAVLERFGFGRAHHRVLHFVNRQPGLRVADLLDILRITKQSLARVLKQLVDREFIQQEAGHEDRRERRLYATVAGKALAKQLTELQTARISAALASAGPAGEQVAKAFLQGMIGQAQQLPLATGPKSGANAAKWSERAATARANATPQNPPDLRNGPAKSSRSKR
jgi:DNA-binding MarR family transcriptional regulator